MAAAILAQGKTDCIAFVQFAFHGSGARPGRAPLATDFPSLYSSGKEFSLVAMFAPGMNNDQLLIALPTQEQAVAVLLESLRALVQSDDPPPRNALVLLLDGAEENVLQAAHGFVSHAWMANVHVFWNIAAGTSRLPGQGCERCKSSS